MATVSIDLPAYASCIGVAISSSRSRGTGSPKSEEEIVLFSCEKKRLLESS
jgi:hypothetical protein